MGRIWSLFTNKFYKCFELGSGCCFYSVKSSPACLKQMKDIPSGRSLPVVGTLFSLLFAGGGNKLHKYIDKRHRQLGTIFREKLGPITSIFLSDVQDIREVFANEGKYPYHVLPESWLLYNELYHYKRGLYFMNGEEWYSYRRTLNSIMLKPDFVDKAYSYCGDIVIENFHQWVVNSKNGEIVNLSNKLYQLSTIFMIAYLIGTPFKNCKDVFLPNAIALGSVVQDIFRYSVGLSMIPAKLAAKLNLPLWKKFVHSVNTSNVIATNLLNDMSKFNGDGILNDLLKEGISSDMLSRIVVDFIIAAGDTTANAAQWILYLLGRHQDIQERLYTDLQNTQFKSIDLPLLRNILKESMRLYPVAPFLTRYLPQDIEIAGYLIPAKELISMSVFTTSRNEKYFPQPYTFNPDRWNRLGSHSKGYQGVIDPYASLPYAAGARSCIGRKLSQGQLMVTIAKMVSLYRLEACNEVDVQLNLIVVPSEPIKLHLRKRP